MNFKKLKWDSSFFGFNVYVIYSTSIKTIQKDITDIWKSGGYLIYVMDNIDLSSKFLNENNGRYVGTKVLFSKSPKVNNDFSSIANFTYSKLPEDILYLAYQSGKDSRFKIDDRLPNVTFEKMYSLWMEKSINNSNIKTFVYTEQEKKLGFITLEISNDSCQVGLFAVDKASRGKGIGKQLINYAENYAAKVGLKEIIIPTQKENILACSFYKKQNYNCINETKMYHFINKNKSYDTI